MISITGKPEVGSQICTFTVGHALLPGKSFNCRSVDQAKGSALLEGLFEIKGVKEIWVEGNKLTVAKTSEEDWQDLGKKLAANVRSLIDLNVELFSKGFFNEPEASKEESSSGEFGSASSELAIKIQNLLDADINPAVASHGGYVKLIGEKDKIAFVEFSGGCQGCSASQQTLSEGIEKAILENIAEIKQVVDVTDHDAGDNPYY